MNFVRKHWFDVGGLLAVIALVFVYKSYAEWSVVRTILWLSLVALFIHQLEEYRYPGYFPGMVNSAMYKSSAPDRYPLNTQTSFIVNVPMGWLVYFWAALFGERFVWLGIGTMLVSLGNVVAHTILFNVKGKTWYNPGMCTALILFVPLLYWFCRTLYVDHVGDTTDWIAGVALGVVLNVVGIVKLIDWMADRNTTYVFERRQLRPEDR